MILGVMEELSAYGITVVANTAMGIESVSSAVVVIMSRARHTAYVHLQRVLTSVCTVI